MLSGRVDEVLAEASRPSLIVGVDDLTVGAATLRNAGLTVEVDSTYLRVELPASDSAHVTKLLADAGLYLNELRAESVSLEELFLSITAHEDDQL